MRPFLTTRDIRSSVAIDHSTGMPFDALEGSVARRVHSTMPSGVGSPDATPSVNGFSGSLGSQIEI